MNAYEPSRLADMELSDAAPAAAGSQVADVAAVGLDWIVVFSGTVPIAAVPASRLQAMTPELPLSEVIRDNPPTVIAHAEVSVASALNSWAFSQMSGDEAVVVVDDSGLCRVWAGPDLAEVRELAERRSAIDTRLPSDEIHIPEISRTCRFESGKGVCGAPVWFAEFPEPMPDCPNPNHVSPHRFVW